MLADILTIIWKEWKEIFLARGNRRSGLTSVLIVIGLLGIFFPLQNGLDWINNPLLPLTWSWLPVFWAIGIVTDSFAGERERHTLETLLSTRLSDDAILFGKIFTAVLYAWGMAMLAMLIGAVTVNVTHFDGSILFYPLDIFFGGMSLSLLLTILMSSLGVLVSLHAPNARQAYQRLSMSFLALWLIPTIGIQFAPESLSAKVFEFFSTASLLNIFLISTVVLLVLDGVLVSLCRARFRRNKLILD